MKNYPSAEYNRTELRHLQGISAMFVHYCSSTPSQHPPSFQTNQHAHLKVKMQITPSGMGCGDRHILKLYTDAFELVAFTSGWPSRASKNENVPFSFCLYAPFPRSPQHPTSRSDDWGKLLQEQALGICVSKSEVLSLPQAPTVYYSSSCCADTRTSPPHIQP